MAAIKMISLEHISADEVESLFIDRFVGCRGVWKRHNINGASLLQIKNMTDDKPCQQSEFLKYFLAIIELLHPQVTDELSRIINEYASDGIDVEMLVQPVESSEVQQSPLSPSKSKSLKSLSTKEVETFFQNRYNVAVSNLSGENLHAIATKKDSLLSHNMNFSPKLGLKQIENVTCDLTRFNETEVPEEYVEPVFYSTKSHPYQFIKVNLASPSLSKKYSMKAPLKMSIDESSSFVYDMKPPQKNEYNYSSLRIRTEIEPEFIPSKSQPTPKYPSNTLEYNIIDNEEDLTEYFSTRSRPVASYLKNYRLELITVDAISSIALDGDLNAVLAMCDITKSDDSHLQWLQRAAEYGHSEAQEKLADRYLHQQTNMKEAVTFLELSAAQGNNSALASLGSCYLNGNGAEKNIEKAVECFKNAALRNHRKAQMSLGYCYETGTGVDQSVIEAVRYYTLSSNQGHAAAQYNLAVCFLEGKGVIKDDKEAVRLFTLSAEQGEVEAQLNLGVCYQRGIGVQKDESIAVKWYELAASQGLANAQFNLANCFLSGKGTTKDEMKAITLFKAAAEQGFADAQVQLGMCYQKGIGAKKDEIEAVKWFELAAQQNNVMGLYCIGACYLQGKGVEKRIDKGMKLLSEAAEMGYLPATKALLYFK